MLGCLFIGDRVYGVLVVIRWGLQSVLWEKCVVSCCKIARLKPVFCAENMY